MREFVVRTCLMIDFLFGIPIFVALIWVKPELYADSLAQSGDSIRERILKYRAENS
jgi:hypothetical protein